MGSRRERSPSELLATVLLADLEGAALAVRETGERSLWENAIGLAGSWRVVPALARRLSDLGERLQPEIAARLEQAKNEWRAGKFTPSSRRDPGDADLPPGG